mmetsp:Transcript_16298/g.34390  ORF Transcript_16298/g.34390 Transcript_16298/m.34390 type:complete len:370 (-) Transcript_16298:23-1132(-)
MGQPQGGHDAMGLVLAQTDVGIGVETENLRAVLRRQRLHESAEAGDDLVPIHNGEAVALLLVEGVVGILEDDRADEAPEGLHNDTPVELVGDAASVNDVCDDEVQRIPTRRGGAGRSLFVIRPQLRLFSICAVSTQAATPDEESQGSLRSFTVTVQELVGGVVESNPPKLQALMQHRVEQRERYQELPPGLAATKAAPRILPSQLIEGTQKARLYALRWLVGHFGAMVEQGWGEVRCQTGCEEKAELARHRLLLVLENILDEAVQGGQPAQGEVAILQHNPSAPTDTVLKSLLCQKPLPAPQGHYMRFLAPAIALNALCHLGQIRYNISTPGQEHKDWHTASGSIKSVLHRRRLQFGIALAECELHILE